MLKYFQQRKILDRLDTDIKNFRGNAIKESIKRGYEEMAVVLAFGRLEMYFCVY